MKTVLRVLRPMGAIAASLAVLFVLLIAVEFFSAVVHPFPADFGGTHDEICAHVARYPAWVLAAVVPMWAAAAFAFTWTARRLGGIGTACALGVLLLAALVFNVSMLPYAAWFKAASLLAIPAAAFAGFAAGKV
jgi:hypothetical protein